MRRSEREIASRDEIDAILHRATVLALALADGAGAPYVVPMNFGYDGAALYLHAAPEGRKIDLLRRNPRVAFAVTADVAVVPGASACQGSMRYRSVLGEGEACFVEAPAEKSRALDLLMRKVAPGPFRYDDAVLARTAIVRIDIRVLSGKQAGF